MELMNLPELTGSEKQIAWATKIRANVIAVRAIAYDLAENWTTVNGKRPPKADKLAAALPKRDTEIDWQNNTARYWIDTFAKRSVATGNEAERLAYIEAAYDASERNNRRVAMADEYGAAGWRI